jgi:catalase-peroxidase
MHNHDSNGSIEKCPVMSVKHRHTAVGGFSNADWWPEQLNLKMLHQNTAESTPLKNFSYKKAFASVDYDALKQDLVNLMTDSQDWWPADYGHYGLAQCRYLPYSRRARWSVLGYTAFCSA